MLDVVLIQYVTMRRGPIHTQQRDSKTTIIDAVYWTGEFVYGSEACV